MSTKLHSHALSIVQSLQKFVSINAKRGALCLQSGKESTKQYVMGHVMKLNKRSSIRKRLNLYVDIYSFDKYLGLYQTRDMTLDGAFIDKCPRKLYPDDLLELHFHVHDVERNPLRLRATVTRPSDEGVGVVFDYGVQEYRQLLDIISTYASDGHSRRIPGFWYVDSSVH